MLAEIFKTKIKNLQTHTNKLIYCNIIQKIGKFNRNDGNKHFQNVTN